MNRGCLDTARIRCDFRRVGRAGNSSRAENLLRLLPSQLGDIVHTDSPFEEAGLAVLATPSPHCPTSQCPGTREDLQGPITRNCSVRANFDVGTEAPVWRQIASPPCPHSTERNKNIDVTYR